MVSSNFAATSLVKICLKILFKDRYINFLKHRFVELKPIFVTVFTESALQTIYIKKFLPLQYLFRRNCTYLSIDV